MIAENRNIISLSFSATFLINIFIEDIKANSPKITGFASRGQKFIYWGPLKPLENFLLRTVIAPWSYVASILYHDFYWYPFVGKKRVNEMLKTGWGKLFLSY